MNLTHVHLLLNHFPTVGMVVGLGLFITAVAARSNDLKRASLAVFFFIALLAIPTFATGTAAQLALGQNPAVSKTAVEAHENAAFLSLWVMELTGALSWFGLWQYRRLSHIPKGTIAAVMVVALVTFGMMARAADMGGEIRHPEILAGPPAAEITPAPTTLTRTIGAGMVDLKWGWPACETIHFVGLCLLFGVVLLIDLRMLGFMKGIGFPALHRLLPWAVLGFGLNVATGMLFFVGAPPSFYVTNPTFFWKLALILVAGANAMYFTVFDQVWDLGVGDTPSVSARFAAASGICLWVGVIFCGQMLPFIGSHSF